VDIIATVGSTGRSTGPHLDFRIYWKNIAVDPELSIKKLRFPSIMCPDPLTRIFALSFDSIIMINFFCN
jgi:murein DD-endopeptidase MepM/ murein hydrolase activator NlpD